MIANANSLAKYIIPIKNGIMIHASVSVKSIVHAKKIIAGIIADVFMRIVAV